MRLGASTGDLGASTGDLGASTVDYFFMLAILGGVRASQREVGTKAHFVYLLPDSNSSKNVRRLLCSGARSRAPYRLL